MYYERKISMKLDSSTLFVNTGRKPLPAMQKKKKTSKNTVALVVCIAIIAVLCVFVGLIVHVWYNYNEEVAPSKPEIEVTETKKQETAPAKTETNTEAQEKKPEKEETKIKTANPTTDNANVLSKAVSKFFTELDGEYAFGIMDIGADYTYIDNTEKVSNSAALGAFLMDYASNGIYLGTFDYTTNVSGHAGRDLMTRAFSQGDVEAANLLIEHFGVDRLNSYMQEKGYENTVFGGTIGSGSESSTTVADLVKLMQKMYNNTTFFPYSDMYKKMKASTVDSGIAAGLSDGASLANIGFSSEGEVFDAGIITSYGRSYIFVAMSQGDKEHIAASLGAVSKGVGAICKYNPEAGDE